MYKKFLSSLLILIIGLLIANKSLNMHVHKLDNGQLIVHAHPYNKSQDNEPVKKHQHSDFEFTLLQHIDVLFVFLFTLSFFKPVLQTEVRNNLPPCQLSNLHIPNLAPRAPPYAFITN